MVKAIKNAIFKDRPRMFDKKREQWRKESLEDHIYFQPKGSAVVENIGNC